MSQADVDDTKVTELRPTNRVKQPTANALRQRKFRKKKKRSAVTAALPVTPSPSVTPSAMPSAEIGGAPAAQERNAKILAGERHLEDALASGMARSAGRYC